VRYALVAPSTSISKTSYFTSRSQGLTFSGRDSLQKDAPKMSYYSISTNILDTDNIELLRVLAKKWKATLPAEIAETEQPKEPTKDE
jgi:hypothetical protein